MMDRRGVLGLPMRLAVAMVIVSVCVPSLVYATETFKADSDVSEAASEVEKMVSAADSVYYSGYGNTCTMRDHHRGRGPGCIHHACDL